MKLGSPFFILLTIVFVATSVALIINEFNVNYSEAGITNSSMDTQFSSYQTTVNSSFGKIADAASNVGSEDGFWDKLIGGTYVIILALIVTVISLITTIPLLGGFVAYVGSEMGVPDAIISLGVVAITGSVVIMIIKFWHRGN